MSSKIFLKENECGANLVKDKRNKLLSAFSFLFMVLNRSTNTYIGRKCYFQYWIWLGLLSCLWQYVVGSVVAYGVLVSYGYAVGWLSWVTNGVEVCVANSYGEKTQCKMRYITVAIVSDTFDHLQLWKVFHGWRVIGTMVTWVTARLKSLWLKLFSFIIYLYA